MDNNFDDVLKISKDLQTSLKLQESMEPICKMTKSLKSMYEPYETALKLGKTGLVFAREVRKMDKILEDMNAKKILGEAERLRMLSSVDVSMMAKSIKQFADIMQQFNKDKGLTAEDGLQKLTNIVQDSLENVDWTQDVSLEEITEEIAEKYIEQEEENTEEKDTKEENSEVKKNTVYILHYINDILAIFASIVTILGFFNSKPPITYNTYNNTIEVSNNYTVELGINAKFINQLGYRIINQNNVMPRIKPDCSSTVTGHLYIGQIVSISDKKKKWIKITWKNDEKDDCSGWVQNYKVSKFK